MPVKAEVSTDKRQILIQVEGKFDFSVHQLFRAAYRDIDTPQAIFKLDLSHASYMDSSALGMILLLKEHAEQLGGSVVIVSPSEPVYKILQIANFYRLVKIER